MLPTEDSDRAVLPHLNALPVYWRGISSDALRFLGSYGTLTMPMNPFAIVQSHLRGDLPDIRPGDTVRVHQKIKEGDKERISIFEGLVIARKHGREPGATFTVRRVVDSIGVERIFPIHSPVIVKIEILRRSKVRRAKLYYIRDKAAREVRRKMKSILVIPAASANGAEETAAA